jgi:hypothetical protein
VQDTFDVICSDLSAFPVSRACAASSAVPMVLSPVTLYDEAERSFLKQIPTSFVLKPEEADHLRDAARRILEKSGEFQRLVQDLH